MILTLERVQLDPDFTIGELSVDGEHICFTCEDAVRPMTGPDWKVRGKTAIPAGEYLVILTWSNRFGRILPLLVDVPCFDGVRIHAGNTAEDTDGCILTGRVRTPNGVGKSGLAFADLFDRIAEARRRGEPVHINVTNPEGFQA